MRHESRSAADFRALTERQQQRVLWVTRISIRSQGNQFDARLDEMVARAARHFGRDSPNLVREYKGTVEVGEPEVVGIEEDRIDEAGTSPSAGTTTDSAQRPPP